MLRMACTVPNIQGVSEQLKQVFNKQITSKQHSTPRQPLEVYYQNQRTPYQRKTGTMLYTNQTEKIVKPSMWEGQRE